MARLFAGNFARIWSNGPLGDLQDRAPPPPRVVECEPGRVFTDESRLPGARMGHRHLIEPRGAANCRLLNTIYIEGPLAPLWRRILGPAAARALPGAQRAIAELAATAPAG